MQPPGEQGFMTEDPEEEMAAQPADESLAARLNFR